jgi:hypothetical protein
MAEAADSSRTGTEFTPEPPAPRRGFVPSPADTGQPYRPLSVAAVISFGLAFFYAAYIGIFAIFTYFSGDFLIFPFWTILLPIGIAILCWVARRSIRNSEGTLSGERFASWGLGLTVVFGLSYWSYFAATSLALRQQAANFVSTRYLPTLMKGNLDEAFVLTYKGNRPTINSKLHNFVETYLNVPSNMKSLPPFIAYCQSEYVRVILQYGEKTKATLVSTGTPTQERGGEMQVPMIYHVETPIEQFDLLVVAMAGDVRSKEFTGRLWRVERDKTYVMPHTPVFTQEGMDISENGDKNARKCISGWITKVCQSFDSESAYRDTLPPGQRTAILAKIKGKKESELKAMAEKDPEVRAYLEGLKAFSEGSIVRADKAVFWAPSDAQGKEMIEQTKKAFSPVNAPANWLTLNRASLPTWSEEGGKVRFVYEGYVMLLPTYVGGCRFVAEADAGVLKDSSSKPESWRMAALELLSCHPAPAPEKESVK